MKRTEKREHIFKMIFQMNLMMRRCSGADAELYLEQLEDAADKDAEYIKRKMQKILEKTEEIDEMINEHAKDGRRTYE